MDIIEQFLKSLAQKIEHAGRIEQQNMRVLQGRCVQCGKKLPANHPFYQCDPDCRSQVTDCCEGNEYEHR